MPIQKIMKYGLMSLLLIQASCTKEPLQESATPSKDLSININVLEMKYEVEATTRYLYDVAEEFSDLDIATMTPLRSKSLVSMRLDTRGDVSMEIEDVPVKQPVEIKHETLPDESPKILKTVIRGGIATFYTDGDRELSTATIEVPNQLSVVQRITESRNCISQEDINYVIATMQGQMFADKLEDFIATAQRDGSQVEKLDEQYVSIRMPLSKANPSCAYETVLLLDRLNNRFIGTTVYNESGEQILTTMFGYGPPEEPYLRAIRQTSKEKLPSGKLVTLETVTRIENMKLKINI